MGMTKEAVEAAGFDRITPEVMMAATKKLVGISRGDADPDDRDSLANQTFHGPEDFKERDGEPARVALTSFPDP